MPIVSIGSVWEGDASVLLLVVDRDDVIAHHDEATCFVLHSTNVFILPGELYHPRSVSLLMHYKRIT